MSPTPKKRKSSKRGKSVVTLQVASSDAAAPLLCAFPGGLPAALQGTDTAASLEDASLPRFVIKHQQRQQHQDIVLVGKDHACLYAATKSNNNNNNKRPLQTVVALYDKQRGVAVVHPTDGFVYTLQQSVLQYKPQTSEATFDKNNNNMDARKALFADFGSAGKQRTMRSQEANRVNVETVVGAGHVQQVVLANMSPSNQAALAHHHHHHHHNNNTHADNHTEAAATAWRQAFLPTYDATADDPAKIYSAAQIAGPVVWPRLVAKVKSVWHKSENDDALTTLLATHDQWYPSVERLLTMLLLTSKAKLSSPHLVTQIATALLLQDFLHLYTQVHRKRWMAPLPPGRCCGVPADVARHWWERFTTPTTADRGPYEGQAGSMMSPAQQDACRVHILLLYVLAEGRYTCADIAPLATDLAVDVSVATHLLRLAGAHVVRTKTGALAATLKVPLVFPSLGKRGGGRR